MDNLDSQQSTSEIRKNTSKENFKNKFKWFKNYKTYKKFGRKDGLEGKVRNKAELLVLYDSDLEY